MTTEKLKLKRKRSLPHITIIIWGTFMISPWAFSEDFPGCPSGTFKTEVASPIDSSKKLLCSKKTSNGYVKHGPEWIYDHEGNLLKKNFYENDELVSSEEMKETSQVPKQDEDKPDKSDSVKKDYSFIKTILHELLHLWHPVKRISRGRLALGGFETQSCDVNDYTLTRFYKNKTESFKLDLDFSKRCSLRGTNKLIWERPQKIELKLRDMRDFKKLEMQLTLYKSTRKEGENTLYRIQTRINQGLLRTETGGLKFEADYILSVDPKQKKALKGHGGELRILEFNGIKIDKSYQLDIKPVEIP